MIWLARVLVFVAILAASAPVFAHPAVRCAAILKVDASGSATLSLRFDVPAFALNEEPLKIADEPMWAFVDGPHAEVERLLRDASGRLNRHVHVRTDGQDLPITLKSFPTLSDFEHWKSSVRTPGEKPRLPWMAEAVIVFDIRTPSATHDAATPVQLTLRFPEVLGDIVLATEVPHAEAQAFVLKAGETSPQISINLGAIPGSKQAISENTTTPLTTQAEPPPSTHGFLSFIRMGIEHIVPDGLDHMLFIIGLYLASPRLRSLLILVTTFTLAHSVTLTLAATGLVVAPPRLIEPIIALSIAAIAIENIISTRKKRSQDVAQTTSTSDVKSEWIRAAIVFAFGLVHGLGFASAFQEMELPKSVLVPALVGFNLGVELGQLLVLCAAFTLIGWSARKSWYRAAVVIPASAAIACVGIYWAVTRIAGE